MAAHHEPRPPIAPFREDEQPSGWSEPRLGRIYSQIEAVRAEIDNGNTEWGCLGDALRAIELADVHIEKRVREA